MQNTSYVGHSLVWHHEYGIASRRTPTIERPAAMPVPTTEHVLHFLTQQHDENPELAAMMPEMMITIAWTPPAQYQKLKIKPTMPRTAPMILHERGAREV